MKKLIKHILNEWFVKIDREKLAGITYREIEETVNGIMGKKYSWWKGIQIEDILYSELNQKGEIYGVLKVDKNWGKKQWKKVRGYLKFPGNNGWDEKSKDVIVRLDDIMDYPIEKEVSKYLSLILSSMTNYTEMEDTYIKILKLIFV